MEILILAGIIFVGYAVYKNVQEKKKEAEKEAGRRSSATEFHDRVINSDWMQDMWGDKSDAKATNQTSKDDTKNTGIGYY